MKRYLQGSHRTGCCTRWGATRPPRRVPRDQLGRGARPRRGRDPPHPAAHGDDAFAMLSGVSLTNEKSYLIGKFARLALHTANLDYNGRFCMVSAGAGNKKALGIDRNANPWSDIPLADVVWVAGSNVAETFPITTSYIWRARDRAPAHRAGPAGRAAGPHRRPVLPVRPGTDSALFGAVLHELIRHDWLDHDFIDAHTVGFDEAASAVAEMTPEWAARSPACRRPASSRPPSGGARRPRDAAPRPRDRAAEQGHGERAAAINLGLATGKYGKPGCGVTTITGQGNGQGGREHGHKCDQLPGNRDITNPEHRAHVAPVWGCDESEIPGKGITAEEIIEAIHAGEIKGCCRSASTRPCRPLTRASPPRRSTGSSSTPSSTSSCPRSAHHADVVLPGSLHEEDEGTSTTGEGRIVKINGPSTRQARRGATGRSSSTWPAARRGQYFPYDRTEQIFEELRLVRPAAPPTTGATWRRIEDEMGLFWPIPRRASGHAAAVRGGRFYHPDGKARFHGVPFREPAEVVDDDYPIWLTTGRVVSQYLSGTQTRRIGALGAVPGAAVRDAPPAGRALGVADGDLVTVRRGAAR